MNESILYAKPGYIPHPKLVTICLPDDGCARISQELHYGRVYRRRELCDDGAHVHQAHKTITSIKRVVPLSIAEEQVVGIVLVHMLSLTAMLMPFKGPSITLAGSS